MSASLLSRPVNQPGAEVLPAGSEVQSPGQDRIREMWQWAVRLEWLVVMLTALVAVALHLRFVTHVGGLWRDETNSVHLATLPGFGEVLRFLDYDSFPVLYFTLLRGWLGVFGPDNDVALRALGCITGFAVLGALWFNARAFGVRWPVLSFALIGLNPMIIRYGDSTRAYGLGILLILLTFRAFWRLVDKPSPPNIRRILVALGLALLSVQCLYYNSVLLLAIAAGTIAVAIRRRTWRTVILVLTIGLAAAASLLPYVAMMRRMREWTFMVNYPADFAWLWKRICEVIGSPEPTGIWIWVGLCVVGLGVAAVIALSRIWGRRAQPGPVADGTKPSRAIPDSVLFAAVALAVGVLGYAVFLRMLQYYTQPWYYIAIVVFAGCALDVLFGSWPGAATCRLPRALRTVQVAVALLLLCLAGVPAWNEMRTRHTNLDLMAARLQTLATNDDVILVSRWECAIPLSRYYRGPAELVTIPPMEDHRLHRYDLVLREMMTVDPMQPVLARLEKTLRSGHHVFVAGKLPAFDYSPPALPPLYRNADGTWHNGPYLKTWQLQTGEFLRAHANRGEQIEVPIPDQAPVQRFESLDLLVMEGWR